MMSRLSQGDVTVKIYPGGDHGGGMVVHLESKLYIYFHFLVKSGVPGFGVSVIAFHW